MQVCKKWLVRAADSVLWKTLYFNKSWGINKLYLDKLSRPTYEEEEALITKWQASSNNNPARDQSQRRFSSTDIMHGYGSLPRDYVNSPLYTESIELDSPLNLEEIVIINQMPYQTNPVIHPKEYDNLSWKFIYQQRLQLEKNWICGRYTSRELLGHTQAVYCIQFDNDKIISGSRDDTIKLWDIGSGLCLSFYLIILVTLIGHTASVLCLQYNDKIVISGSSDSLVFIWDIKTGKF